MVYYDDLASQHFTGFSCDPNRARSVCTIDLTPNTATYDNRFPSLSERNVLNSTIYIWGSQSIDSMGAF